MMRGMTKIIIGIVTLLVLSGGIALLLLWPESGEGDPDASEQPTVTDTPYLVQTDSALFKKMTVTLADGDSYTVTTADSVYTLEKPLAALTVNSYNVSGTVAAALAPIITYEITTATDNATLDKYGLARPAARVKVELTDGTGYELLIGNPTPTDSGYYAMKAGSGRIVTISLAQGERLLRSTLSMHSLSLFPSYYDADSASYTLADVFDTLTLRYPDETVLQIRQRSTEEMQAGSDDPVAQFSSYVMLSPFQGAGYDYGIQESLLTPLMSISPSAAVAGSGYDPADYGLDTPYTLSVNDALDWSLTLYIGGVDADSGGRYLAVEGLDYVFLDTAGDYSFLTVKPVFFRSATLWMYNIKDVSTVLMELGGVTRLYTVDDNDDGITSDLDGVPLSEDNARRLYMRLIGLQANGQNTTDVPGETLYRLTLTLKTGKTHILEFKRLNDRQLEAFMDGEDLQLCLNTSDFNALLTALDVIDSGGTLERY